MHPSLYNILLVALGGALGAAGRYGFGLWAASRYGVYFPWGTFGVNIIGSFFMGLVMALIIFMFHDHQHMRLFLATGFLGGFTTFSAFSIEMANLIEIGRVETAALYGASSVILGLIAVFAGLYLGRVLAG